MVSRTRFAPEMLYVLLHSESGMIVLGLCTSSTDRCIVLMNQVLSGYFFVDSIFVSRTEHIARV